MHALDRLTQPELPLAVATEATVAPAITYTNALAWWPGGTAITDRWWADGLRGRYVVALDGDCWHVDHRRQSKTRRQLGTAVTANEAMALAQADHDLAHAASESAS